MTVKRAAQVARWRNGLAIAALVIPCGLFLLFERQARRLEALVDHGVPVRAQVTRVSRNGTTHYAYRFGGQQFTWNVKRKQAPYRVGQRFDAVVLPEDPALSRPVAVSARVAPEIARNRTFSKFAVAIAFAFFAGFALLLHRDVRRLGAGIVDGPPDPVTYKRRLVGSFAVLLVPVTLIGVWHGRDALRAGESIVPVVIAGLLSLAVVAGTMFYAGRDGPSQARARTVKLMAWLAPLAIGVAVLRLLMLLFRS